MDPAGQAAWVQGTVSIAALIVAIFIPYWQKYREQVEKAATNRKIVMSAAANLDIALGYQSVIFDFSPAGDGVIGHDLTLDHAREFMKLQPQTRDALQRAIEMSHYFSEELCGRIVRLGIETAAYERIVEEAARRTPDADADEFFRRMQGTKNALAERVCEVRKLLKKYLPDA